MSAWRRRLPRVWWEWHFGFSRRRIWIGVEWKTYPAAIEFRVGLLPMLQLYLYAQMYS